MIDSVLTAEQIIALFVSHLLVAMIGTLFVYKLIEINWGLSVVGSFGLAVGALIAMWEWQYPFWDPTFLEFEQGAIVAVTGVITGIALIVTLFEPESRSGDDGGNSNSSQERSGSITGNGPDIPSGFEDLEN